MMIGKAEEAMSISFSLIISCIPHLQEPLTF